jgi:hypothetical protein
MSTTPAAHVIRLAQIEGRNCLACTRGDFSIQLSENGVSLDRGYAEAAQGHIDWATR